MAVLANLKMKKTLIIPHFLEAYCKQKLRVGFSGGADSTALLLLLLKWGWSADLLEAVHFDHGLRGSASTADGLWCQEFCAKRGIKCTLVKLELAEKAAQAGSLEEAARNARFDWYRANDDNSPVVLAHHAGDVQENLLLKLARGGNVSALTSLRSKRKLWNLTILRPLLNWHKSDLEEFLHDEGIHHWRVDATNQQSDYHRNFLRNDILPRWAEFHQPLGNALDVSAKVLAMDADFIEEAAVAKLAELGEKLPEKTSCRYWLDMHEALLGRVLRSYALRLTGNNEIPLTFQNVENFRHALLLPESSESRIVEVNKLITFKLTGGTLKFINCDAPATLQEPRAWRWREASCMEYGKWLLECELLPGAVSGREKGVFYFDADQMPEVLCCSLRQGGEHMQVWGSDRPRKVKHLLSGVSNKSDMLVVSDEEQNIYLLGNLRRSFHAPVTGNSCSTLKIVVKYLE